MTYENRATGNMRDNCVYIHSATRREKQNICQNSKKPFKANNIYIFFFK